MKAVILAGGLGTRLAEASVLRPKSPVKVSDRGIPLPLAPMQGGTVAGLLMLEPPTNLAHQKGFWPRTAKLPPRNRLETFRISGNAPWKPES